MTDQDMRADVDFSPTQLYDREMEEALIGSVIINPDVYHEVAPILKPEDFHLKAHQWIWDAFRDLFQADQSFDVLTLKQQLESNGHIEDIGGVEYLVGLSSQVPTSLHAESYARNINALATRRRLLSAANDVAKLAYRKDYSIDTVLEESEKQSLGLAKTAITATWCLSRLLLQNTWPVWVRLQILLRLKRVLAASQRVWFPWMVCWMACTSRIY